MAEVEALWSGTNPSLRHGTDALHAPSNLQAAANFSHASSTTMATTPAAQTSPEDRIWLWQWMTVSWLSPLIRAGSQRQLQDEDVWQLPASFQHRQLHQYFRSLQGTVIQRLLKANWLDIALLSLLGLVTTVLDFAGPLLLQKLLQAMENFDTESAIRWAGISLAVRVFAAQTGVFGLWYGRRCYERSRGEMITMLYEKTLNRKINFAPPPEVLDTNGVKANGVAEGQEPLTVLQRAWARVRGFFRRTKSAPPAQEAASMGKILNLMRNDVYEVSQRFWEVQSLVQKPLSVIFSIVLVIRLLGLPSLMAIGLLLVVQVIVTIIARIMIHFEMKRRRATDGKLQLITQFVEAIRHLRWYGWQGTWLTQIMDARQKELNLRIVTSVWQLSISFFNTLGLDLTPSIAFFAYTVIARRPLTVDVAFPALQVLQMMSSSLRDLPQLIIVCINAWVAVARIEDFMAEPDKEEKSHDPVVSNNMALYGASFAWPGSSTAVLRDLTLDFDTPLTVICGEVGSGKSALLQALLGELDQLAGDLICPDQPIAYCAQTPWLQSMSIQENILFGMPYEEKRYREVLEACQLLPDMKELKSGDQSFIGENGIGLSGGQRARVALARAVYSTSNILLLDDPLSALDQQTAEAIVRKVFEGLLKERTVVVVTHRTDLFQRTERVAIEMQGGRALKLDSTAVASDTIGLSLRRHSTTKSGDQHAGYQVEEQKAVAVPDKFIEEEHRAHGGVQASVYWEYIKAGRLRWWCLLIIMLTLYRLVSVFETWFLKAWGEAYNQQPSLSLILQSEDYVHAQQSLPALGGLPPPDVNIKPWLIGFLIIGLCRSLTYIAAQAVMIVIIYTAGKNMFIAIMEKVAGATFRFYDVTPVGRLMNRMTSDISVIDGNISQQFSVIAWLGISWISSMAMIAVVTPLFLAFAVLLTIAFVLIFRRFIPTSQSLRRLEMVSLTPLMSNFGALLNGLSTVRAFHAQQQFQDRVIRVVDTFQKMDHFYWSLQAWLMYRYDMLSAAATFLVTMMALWTDVSAGWTAFVLVAANKLVQSTHYLCKQYGQLQMEFVSVERVVELLHLEQESKGAVSPPAWWPSFNGDIVFDGVTIKYAPHMDPALAGIKFTIKGGSKTAIIGRTGSGKSTLALSLLATILPEAGNITIDSIDLAEVDKQLLRTRITFLAQDPVLFPGTMRQNLDPVNEHSNEACDAVLHRTCSRQGWELDTKIEAGGRNLSQGQRQLVGLARAVLRRSAIVILDEATASIDRDTAVQIQQVMHEEMRESTVITIAHRVEAVRNADYCVVLGRGEIVDQGPADEVGRRMAMEGRRPSLPIAISPRSPGAGSSDGIEQGPEFVPPGRPE